MSKTTNYQQREHYRCDEFANDSRRLSKKAKRAGISCKKLSKNLAKFNKTYRYHISKG